MNIYIRTIPRPAPAAYRAPAGVYPFAGFTLTLPVAVAAYGPPRTFTPAGVYVSDDAADVTSSTDVALADYASQFWYLDEADGIVCTAPSNGATTSPLPPNTPNPNSNSEHTRTEAVQRYTGPGATGTDWNSAIGGRMVGSCFVSECAANSGQVTFAQIHGQGTPPFVLLVWRKSSNRIEANIYRSRADYSSANRETFVLKTGVNLGDQIDFDMRYAGSKLVFVLNGTTTVVEGDYAVGDGPLLATGWAGTPVRFSFGAYHSPDTGDGNVDNRDNPPGDRTRVTYSAFAITHPYVHP